MFINREKEAEPEMAGAVADVSGKYNGYPFH